MFTRTRAHMHTYGYRAGVRVAATAYALTIGLFVLFGVGFGAGASDHDSTIAAGSIKVNRVSLGTFQAAGHGGEGLLCFVTSPADNAVIAAVGDLADANTTKDSYLVKLAPPTWTEVALQSRELGLSLLEGEGKPLQKGAMNCTVDSDGRYAYFASAREVIQVDIATLLTTAKFSLDEASRLHDYRVVSIHSARDSVYVVASRRLDSRNADREGLSAPGRVIRLSTATAPLVMNPKRTLLGAGPGLLPVSQAVDLELGRPRASVLAPTAGLLFVATDGLGARALRLDDLSAHADVPRISGGSNTVQGPYSGAVAESVGRLYFLSLPNPVKMCAPCPDFSVRARQHARGLFASNEESADFCSNCDGATRLLPVGQACGACPTPPPRFAIDRRTALFDREELELEEPRPAHDHSGAARGPVGDSSSGDAIARPIASSPWPSSSRPRRTLAEDSRNVLVTLFHFEASDSL